MKAKAGSPTEQAKTSRTIPSAVEIKQTTLQHQISEKKRPVSGFAVVVPLLRSRGPVMHVSSPPYEVLNLALDGVESSLLCRNTMKLLANARRIIVVAGAGISVAAGIPDFRSSTGL